jgi:hypothetical protein
MKAMLSICLALFIPLFSIGSSQADDNKAHNTNSQLTADLLDANYVSRQPYTPADNSQDTIAQQTKALNKINEALARGAITPDQASALAAQVNGIGASESWYKSLAIPVPEATIKANAEKITALNTQLDKSLALNFNQTVFAPSTNYSDVSKLIGNAAANNKISNAQAAQYYTQLAQIESDRESLKYDPASSKTELSDLNAQLKLLKANIQGKLK